MLLARSDEMNRKERKTQRGITKDAGSVALNLPSLNSPPPSSSIFPGALLVISLSLFISPFLLSVSPFFFFCSNYVMWKALEMLANSVPVLPRINSKAIRFIETLILDIKRKKSCYRVAIVLHGIVEWKVLFHRLVDRERIGSSI